MGLLGEGMGVREVARMVGASPGSVTVWRQRYEREGADGLASRPHPGPRPKLDAGRRAELLRLLGQGPRAHGYTTESWTLPRVAAVIERRFGVNYDPSSVWHLLRQAGWTCQKPEQRARERDEAAVERWRGRDWPRIKKRPVGTAGGSCSSTRAGSSCTRSAAAPGRRKVRRRSSGRGTAGTG